MSLPFALRMRRHRVRWARSLRRRLAGTGTVYVGERLAQYRDYWATAAAELGAEFEELASHVWEARLGDRKTRMSNYIVQLDDSVTNTLAGDKPYGYKLARELRIPTPAYASFTLERLADAQRFLASLEGPAVVKPARGSASGLGITTWVESADQLADAACLAAIFCPEWIVESMHFGESYRLLMLDGELLHAVRRRGLRVVGDGRSTVEQLLPRGAALDRTALATLAGSVADRSTVPAEGDELLVRSIPPRLQSNRELRTEYDEAVTDRLHPELVEAARLIAAGFGSRFAGVDFVTPDPEKSLSACGGVFLELNTTPGIHHHDVEPKVRPLPVAVRVLTTLLRAGESEI